jgi:hypothetical protein
MTFTGAVKSSLEEILVDLTPGDSSEESNAASFSTGSSRSGFASGDAVLVTLVTSSALEVFVFFFLMDVATAVLSGERTDCKTMASLQSISGEDICRREVNA